MTTGIQPIRYFVRLDLRKFQYLSENILTHVELNIVLEMIAMSDRNNVLEAGEPLSQYLQNRFSIGKRVMNRYLKKIRELRIYTPIEDRPEAYRGMPLLYNRLQILPSLWEYKNVHNDDEWIFGQSYEEWVIKGNGSKLVGSPSHARLANRSSKSEEKIPRFEHDKIVTEMKRKHTEETKIMKLAFTEIIEENRLEYQKAREENRIALRRNEEKLEGVHALLLEILSKVDCPNEVQDKVKRHLELVKS